MSFVHVLDLPQLYTKPSGQVLLDTLHSLTITPPSFGNEHASKTIMNDDPGLPRYFTNIIASPLHWIDDPALQEEIWQAASLRLAERSGRTAMPSCIRTFEIPTGDAHNSLKVQLQEPSITGENLGHKTWGAAYLLAKRLHLLRDKIDLEIELAEDEKPSCRSILELGSGTGLVGLTAAAILETSVFLTDLPDIVDNLKHNITLNQNILDMRNGTAEAFALDWRDVTTPPKSEKERYRVILAADSIYSSEQPAWLFNGIQQNLSYSREARVILEVPLREGYTADLQRFITLMETPFVLLQQSEDQGFDDWHDGEDVIRTWWGIWKRKT